MATNDAHFPVVFLAGATADVQYIFFLRRASWGGTALAVAGGGRPPVLPAPRASTSRRAAVPQRGAHRGAASGGGRGYPPPPGGRVERRLAALPSGHPGPGTATAAAAVVIGDSLLAEIELMMVVMCARLAIGRRYRQCGVFNLSSYVKGSDYLPTEAACNREPCALFCRRHSRSEASKPRCVPASFLTSSSRLRLGCGVSVADVPTDLPRRGGSGGDGAGAGLPGTHAPAEQVRWNTPAAPCTRSVLLSCPCSAATVNSPFRGC